MMWPASPCSRMSRVVAMEMPSRNSVVTSSTDGNDENASGDGRYMATISSVAEMVMLTPMSASTASVGSGRIIMKMMATIITARMMSLRLVSAAMPRLSRLCMIRLRAGTACWRSATKARIAAMASSCRSSACRQSERSRWNTAVGAFMASASSVASAACLPLRSWASASAQRLVVAGLDGLQRVQQGRGPLRAVVFQIDEGQQRNEFAAFVAEHGGRVHPCSSALRYMATRSQAGLVAQGALCALHRRGGLAVGRPQAARSAQARCSLVETDRGQRIVVGDVRPQVGRDEGGQVGLGQQDFEVIPGGLFQRRDLAQRGQRFLDTFAPW